jgi:hypothetical protein
MSQDRCVGLMLEKCYGCDYNNGCYIDIYVSSITRSQQIKKLIPQILKNLQKHSYPYIDYWMAALNIVHPELYEWAKKIMVLM